MRELLGPKAVVLKTWKLPTAGLARLWQKPRVGVLAGVVECAPAPQDLRTDLLEKISPLNPKPPPPPAPERKTIESLLSADRGSPSRSASDDTVAPGLEPQAHLLI